MAKNKEIKNVESAEEPVVETVSAPLVDSLNTEFGREDLNSLRDKLNEVITRINALGK